MAEKSTIARPYAEAAFAVAKAKDRLKAWSEALAFCARVAQDPQVQALMGNTRVTRAQLAELFIDLAGERLDAEGRNLMRLLAENRRLAVLPEIAVQFEALRAEAEHTLQADLVAAFEVSEAQRRRIAARLTERLGRTVNLRCVVDPALIGGAVVRAGDLVIDGTVAGRLRKLSVALNG